MTTELIEKNKQARITSEIQKLAETTQKTTEIRGSDGKVHLIQSTFKKGPPKFKYQMIKEKQREAETMKEIERLQKIKRDTEEKVRLE